MRKPSEKKENTFRTINPENGLLCIKHLHLRRPAFGSCCSVQFLRNRYAWTLDFLRYAIFEHHVSHISSRNDIREFDIIKMVRDLRRRRKRPKIVHVVGTILEEFIILENTVLHPSQPSGTRATVSSLHSVICFHLCVETERCHL